MAAGSYKEVAMREVPRVIGIDLGKSVFQVHAVVAGGRVVVDISITISHGIPVFVSDQLVTFPVVVGGDRMSRNGARSYEGFCSKRRDECLRPLLRGNLRLTASSIFEPAEAGMAWAFRCLLPARQQ